MDDQNQTNQLLNQGSPPIVPSAPLDISPLPLPTPQPEIGQPVIETPVTEEVPMPKAKHKSKIMPIIGGVVALLLVVGVAGAAYYVSNQLSTRQAVAPNAPTSKPLANQDDCVGVSPIPIESGCPSGYDGCGYINGVNSCCCVPGGGGGDDGGGTADACWYDTGGDVDGKTIVAGTSIHIGGWGGICRNSALLIDRVDVHICNNDGTNCQGLKGTINRNNRSESSLQVDFCSANVPGQPNSLGFDDWVTIPVDIPPGEKVIKVVVVSADPADGSQLTKWCGEPVFTVTAAIPTCGTGLYCSSTQPSGASQCTDEHHLNGWWCCPLGQKIINGACVVSTIPDCGTGLYCSAANPPIGSEQCQRPDGETWCCPLGQKIINGACVVPCTAGSCPSGGTCNTNTGVCDGCVPDGTISCSPDCSTLCSTAASTITTCTDSCGAATTKACPATALCDCVSSSWNGCSVSCGGGTQKDNCGTSRACNEQACCTAAGTCPTCRTSASTVPNGSCGDTTCDVNCSTACSGTTCCTAAGTCPTTCHTDNQTVPNGSCGTTPCPSNAPAAVTCTTTCGYVGGDKVADGSCGEKTCAATAPCPVNGVWSTAWSACVTPVCGAEGTKTRTCNNPAPAYGGAECTKTDETLTTASNRVEIAACDAVNCVLEGSKATYKNVTSNTSGNYSLTTVAETVSKSQIYVYSVALKNASTATASGVTIKDSLKDLPIAYMDAVAGCTWNATNTELTCNTSINPNETKKFSFRVKALDSVANGTEIANTARITFADGSLDLSKSSAVSTVVGCNHTCIAAEECSTGLTCDTTTSKCRTSACLTEDDCSCTIAASPTVTRSVTRAATATIAPTKTVAPTRVVTQAEEVIAEATPTILPETGIFDLPGIVAFGGGLLLAIIGILLAL